MSIEFQNVSFRYPDGTLADKNLNLTIQNHERVAIIGQNGAGKTTAVKLMNRLYPPSEGDVLIDGVNTKDKTTAQISKMVGYVFQNPDDQIFRNTVRDEIKYWARYQKLPAEEVEARALWAAKLCDVEKYLDVNPYEIPYSLKKFVSIAAVLTAKTQYLILDEPTAGQDMSGIACLRRIMDELQSEGKAVITITHDMEFASTLFPRIIVMCHGEILADGTPDEIFARDAVLSKAKVIKPQVCWLSNKLGFGNILSMDTLVDRIE